MSEQKQQIRNILVTGGAGYVGSVLVQKLVKAGYRVTVLDLYIYGTEVLQSIKASPLLKEVIGDIRDQNLLKKILPKIDAVIHLACISNDPSFELDPNLAKSINYDAFPNLVDIAKDSGVKRFIYASSSSVYGIKKEPYVTEDLSLQPLTDYSKYKALCEDILEQKRQNDFITLTLRPATVCGYSPRMRLDLTVNILTNHAVNNRNIRVFGGSQMRPNINIEDITDLYVKLMAFPDKAIDGKIFNVGHQNHKVSQIAELVKSKLDYDVSINTVPTNDHRSYHISSEAISRELGFKPKHGIDGAINNVITAFSRRLIPDPMTKPIYYNIEVMKNINLK